jgi:tetratricopeptide (TPR) repeat protein
MLAMQGGPNLIHFGIDADESQSMGPASDSSTTERIDEVLTSVEGAQEHDLLKEGYDLFRRNKFREAQAVFEKDVERHPGSYYAWLGKGMSVFMIAFGSPQLGDPDRALFEDADKAFRQAIELAPELPDARINRAITLTKLERPQEALDEWANVDVSKLSKEQVQSVNGWIRRAEEEFEKMNP